MLAMAIAWFSSDDSAIHLSSFAGDVMFSHNKDVTFRQVHQVVAPGAKLVSAIAGLFSAVYFARC